MSHDFNKIVFVYKWTGNANYMRQEQNSKIIQNCIFITVRHIESSRVI